MADKKGYILLNRNITEWGWYNNLKTCHIFIHLLLKANFKEGVFMGQKINRGELATSRRTLAHECNLTENEVDTALLHLKQTDEIRIKRCSKFLVITIVNYSDYQEQPNQNRIISESLPNQSRNTSEQSINYIKGNKGKKGKKGRSAPGSPSGERSMPGRDEGTADDIPEKYRDRFKTYAEYFDWRNQ